MECLIIGSTVCGSNKPAGSGSDSFGFRTHDLLSTILILQLARLFIDPEQIRCGAMDADAVFHQEHNKLLTVHQSDISNWRSHPEAYASHKLPSEITRAIRPQSRFKCCQ